MIKCKLQCLNVFTNRVLKMMNNNGGTSSSPDRCSCEESDMVRSSEDCEASTSKDKKNKINLFGLCRDKTKRNKKLTTTPSSSITKNVVRKSPKWGIKFSCTKKEPKISFHQSNPNCCRCTCYQHVNEGISGHNTVAEVIVEHNDQPMDRTMPVIDDESGGEMRGNEPIIEENPQGIRGVYSISPATSSVPPLIITAPVQSMQWIRNHEDSEEVARIARAREIEQGVEVPASFRSIRRVQLLYSDFELDPGQPLGPPRRLQLVCPPDLSVESLRALFQNHVTLKSCPLDTVTGCHTQVDFIHCLVPDLLTITNCSFYWGKMDRYEAERLLDGKPEGTFLLRDSAQEEFLFSVSFRKYGRSLHARIEQWNHKFSFDSHDPGVYTSNTVCGLIEHYKDPSSCMFFEPILTLPLHRKVTFSLQHLSRAVIVSRLSYDNINHLQLPKTLKTYLKEYHYRQKVRVERFDDDFQWLEVRNTPA